ncbi:hypothetical protein [Henriciella aquimarina]|uniref:hypothetical protein n=1 Tax=Henriciella aquimarina TaxID=545261 RepID=UPI000A06E419|nr:hypothetical protein [Henriciella aquimarina]
MKAPTALPLLLVALLQVLVPLLPVMGIGNFVGTQFTRGDIPPELPLGPFFSIWSVIFALYFTFALFALLKPSYLEAHLGAPLLAAGAGNVVWMLSAQFLANDWLNFLLLIPILVFSWQAARRLHRMGGWDGTGRRLVAVTLTGLLSGWLTAAFSVSVPEVVRTLFGLAPTDQVWLSLWCALIPAGLLAWAFASRISRSLWFFVALGWGLTGVALNNWLRTETHGLAIMTVVFGLYVIWRRLRYGARPAFE